MASFQSFGIPGQLEVIKKALDHVRVGVVITDPALALEESFALVFLIHIDYR